MRRIRQKWDQGAIAAAGWLQIPSPASAEALAGAGLDALVVDLQHGFTTIDQAVDMFRAIEGADCEPMARLRGDNPAEAMWLLDMGATGLIAPLIEDGQSARNFAHAIHYPPRGGRSYGPRRPLLRHGSHYVSIASELLVSWVMIETRSGLENLDAILAVDGFDGVFIGPADLALSLGCAPGARSAALEDAIELILESCKRAGRRAGIFCADGAQAGARAAQGFDFVTLKPDLQALSDAVRADLATLETSLRAVTP